MSAPGYNDSAQQLRSFVERVERIEEEISALNADKSEIYKEARGNGFDVKALRKVVAQRKLDPSEREERDALFDLYWSAIHGSDEDLSRARAHAREIIEEFDPETGEITEQPETARTNSPASEHKTAGHAPLDEGSEDANTEQDNVDRGVDVEIIERNTSGPDAKRAPNSPSADQPAVAVAEPQATQAQTATAPHSEMRGFLSGLTDEQKAGALAYRGPETHGEQEPFQPPAFLQKDRKPLRPHCQRPDNCGGYGRIHCGSCLKASHEVAA